MSSSKIILHRYSKFATSNPYFESMSSLKITLHRYSKFATSNPYFELMCSLKITLKQPVAASENQSLGSKIFSELTSFGETIYLFQEKSAPKNLTFELCAMVGFKLNLNLLLLPPQVLPEIRLKPLDQDATLICLGVRV